MPGQPCPSHPGWACGRRLRVASSGDNQRAKQLSRHSRAVLTAKDSQAVAPNTGCVCVEEGGRGGAVLMVPCEPKNKKRNKELSNLLNLFH